MGKIERPVYYLNLSPSDFDVDCPMCDSQDTHVNDDGSAYCLRCGYHWQHREVKSNG